MRTFIELEDHHEGEDELHLNPKDSGSVGTQYFEFPITERLVTYFPWIEIQNLAMVNVGRNSLASYYMFQNQP